MLRVTWRHWAALAVIAGAYILLGWLGLKSDGNAEAWIYRIGLTGAALTPFALVSGYAIARQKWWTNDISSLIVLVTACFVPSFAPLAWVFWFNEGRLTNSMLGWIAVSGPGGATVTVFLLAFVIQYLGRAGRNSRNQGDDDQ